MAKKKKGKGSKKKKKVIEDPKVRFDLLFGWDVLLFAPFDYYYSSWFEISSSQLNLETKKL